MLSTEQAEALKQPMQQYVYGLQDTICQALERLDGSRRFLEDPWNRPGGGGGRTRVMQGGAVFEKAGVGASAVFGELEEAFARRLQGQGNQFFATGISLVLHPRNPFVPTVHANFRYIVQGSKAWFGGGTDLTPYYLIDEDAQHFHRTLKSVCDRHNAAYYSLFKQQCDAYFFLKHRLETRGIGGLFFENMGGDLESEFAFIRDCGDSFLAAYLPIAERRKDLPFSEAQRHWQEVRRGRYVEFNLLYDRGTLFGLETQGRTESILMSLPPRCRWDYDHQSEEGSEENRLSRVLKSPQAWI